MSTLAVARVYTESFNKSPKATLAIVGGGFNALGDFVAQSYQNTYARKDHEPKPHYDYARTLRFFCFGFCISPLIGKWNVFLEHRFPLRAVSAGGRISFRSLGKRVAADQLIMAPTGLALFLGSMGVMEGRDKTQIHQKYSDLYVPALVTNWQVWPIAQLINFRFMPLPYRVPFQSTCGVFWTLYLSIINSREDKKQDNETKLRQTVGR
ncbi:vacuolar membrane protein [Moniliophthora roreri MCA 2997]|uniref:Vacuolar membrane protein n=1 Tax=Moniliophthora roreri (strain MCA 2997) TaxID=1381753 RepID=V2Y109_MONRO|nr:vacuolar membrane protein [Moniliophthora roreri MCA 2997]